MKEGIVAKCVGTVCFMFMLLYPRKEKEHIFIPENIIHRIENIGISKTKELIENSLI